MSIIPPHDPLCPMAVGPAFANSGPLAYCQCDLITKIRADEQDKRLDKIADLLEKWTGLRAQVEALHRPERVHYPSVSAAVQQDGWNLAIDSVLALLDGKE